MTGTIFFKYHLMEIYWAEQIMSWQLRGEGKRSFWGLLKYLYFISYA